MKKILGFILFFMLCWKLYAWYWYGWEGILEYWNCNKLAEKHFIVEKKNLLWDYNCYFFEDNIKIFMIDIEGVDRINGIRSIYFGTEIIPENIVKIRNKKIKVSWGATWWGYQALGFAKRTEENWNWFFAFSGPMSFELINSKSKSLITKDLLIAKSNLSKNNILKWYIPKLNIIVEKKSIQWLKNIHAKLQKLSQKTREHKKYKYIFNYLEAKILLRLDYCEQKRSYTLSELKEWVCRKN